MYTKLEYTQDGGITAWREDGSAAHFRQGSEKHQQIVDSGVYIIPFEPEDNLPGIKEEANYEITSKAEQILSSPVELNGYYLQTRSQDRTRILGTLMFYQLLGEHAPATIDWITLDNSTQTFPMPDFVSFAMSLVTREQQVLFTARSYKDQVLAASTEAEVSVILEAALYALSNIG